MCSSKEQWRTRRCSSSWSVFDRGAELQDGGVMARTGGLASTVQKCTIAPVKRSGIAEGPWSQRQSFPTSFDLFLFDLLARVYLSWSAFYHFYPVEFENSKQIEAVEPRGER